MPKYFLENRTALITGANQGLGYAIASAYVTAGANVVICGRDGELLEKAQQAISKFAVAKQRVIAQVADVSKQEDIEKLVETTFTYFSEVHILVNNAGIYGPKGTIEQIDWNDWLKAIEINLFGSVMMCRALLPHFKQRHYGKIIQLSGGGATNPLPYLSAYAASKAAVVRFAETLAEEVRAYHIDVNAIAPGALNTRLLDEILEAGPEKVGTEFYNRALKQKRDGGVSFERGAELAVFLASSASDGITGKLISAVWDPWEKLPEYLADLQTTDIYTLRRIVPKDRGKDWG